MGGFLRFCCYMRSFFFFRQAQAGAPREVCVSWREKKNVFFGISKYIVLSLKCEFYGPLIITKFLGINLRQFISEGEKTKNQTFHHHLLCGDHIEPLLENLCIYKFELKVNSSSLISISRSCSRKCGVVSAFLQHQAKQFHLLHKLDILARYFSSSKNINCSFKTPITRPNFVTYTFSGRRT
jgi:hypothetical protein